MLGVGLVKAGPMKAFLLVGELRNNISLKPMSGRTDCVQSANFHILFQKPVNV